MPELIGTTENGTELYNMNGATEYATEKALCPECPLLDAEICTGPRMNNSFNNGAILTVKHSPGTIHGTENLDRRQIFQQAPCLRSP